MQFSPFFFLLRTNSTLSSNLADIKRRPILFCADTFHSCYLRSVGAGYIVSLYHFRCIRNNIINAFTTIPQSPPHHKTRTATLLREFTIPPTKATKQRNVSDTMGMHKQIRHIPQ